MEWNSAAIKEHARDSAVICVGMCPCYAAIECLIVDMDCNLSLTARAYGAIFTFLGTGKVYAKGRDLWHRKFNVPDGRVVRGIHDALYGAAFNLVFAPVLYVASGERDLHHLVVSSLWAAAASAPIGTVGGYAIDLYRNADENFLAAAAFTAASVTTMLALYVK